MRQHNTLRCEFKEGSFHDSIEVTGQVQHQQLYTWANRHRYLMSRKDGQPRAGLDALEQRKNFLLLPITEPRFLGPVLLLEENKLL